MRYGYMRYDVPGTAQDGNKKKTFGHENEYQTSMFFSFPSKGRAQVMRDGFVLGASTSIFWHYDATLSMTGGQSNNALRSNRAFPA